MEKVVKYLLGIASDEMIPILVYSICSLIYFHRRRKNESWGKSWGFQECKFKT